MCSYWQWSALSTRSGGEKLGKGSWETSGRRPILIIKSNLILVSHWHLREKDPLSTNSVDACRTSSMPTITREISWTRRNDKGVCAVASKPRRPLYVVPVSNWVGSEKSKRYSARYSANWAIKNGQTIHRQSHRTHCSPSAGLGHASHSWPSGRWLTPTCYRN